MTIAVQAYVGNSCHRPTVCPSKDSASMLSYQWFPTSIQVWRGHGQEAKIRWADRHRITRNLKRLGRSPPTCGHRGVPWRGVMPERRHASGAAVDACHGTTAWARRAERAADGGVVDVSRARSVLPRAL